MKLLIMCPQCKRLHTSVKKLDWKGRGIPKFNCITCKGRERSLKARRGDIAEEREYNSLKSLIESRGLSKKQKKKNIDSLEFLSKRFRSENSNLYYGVV